MRDLQNRCEKVRFCLLFLAACPLPHSLCHKSEHCVAKTKQINQTYHIAFILILLTDSRNARWLNSRFNWTTCASITTPSSKPPSPRTSKRRWRSLSATSISSVRSRNRSVCKPYSGNSTAAEQPLSDFQSNGLVHVLSSVLFSLRVFDFPFSACPPGSISSSTKTRR